MGFARLGRTELRRIKNYSHGLLKIKKTTQSWMNSISVMSV